MSRATVLSGGERAPSEASRGGLLLRGLLWFSPVAAESDADPPEEAPVRRPAARAASPAPDTDSDLLAASGSTGGK